MKEANPLFFWFFNYFGIIKEIKQQSKVRHLLIYILFIAVELEKTMDLKI
jgi:hypothetical protein